MDIRALLKTHHERLDELFASLLAGGGDIEWRRQAFGDFEAALIAHFETEEAHLFPFLEADFPEEIRALREEHELIRREVGSILGDGPERPLDPTAAQALDRRLRLHARREEGLVYTLANDDAASDRYRKLSEYLDGLYARMRVDEADD